MALSIMTFSCMILLGLLPSGIRTVHDAISATVQAQIIQNIVNSSEIQPYTSTGVFTNAAGSPAVYYFDDEGTYLGTSVTQNYVYQAKVYSSALSLPGAAGSSVPLQMSANGSQPVIASKLQVVITAINNPNVATTNTIVWPNCGN